LSNISLFADVIVIITFLNPVPVNSVNKSSASKIFVEHTPPSHNCPVPHTLFAEHRQSLVDTKLLHRFYNLSYANNFDFLYSIEGIFLLTTENVVSAINIKHINA